MFHEREHNFFAVVEDCVGNSEWENMLLLLNGGVLAVSDAPSDGIR